MRLAFLSLTVIVALGSRAQYTTDHPVDTWTLAPFEQVSDVRTFDVEGDGDQDVFVNRYALFSTGTLTWYRNNGLGVFAPGVTISSGAAFAEDFDLGDVDGDGDLDLAYNAYPGGSILVRLFSGGAFGAPQTWGGSGGWARYLRFMQLDPLENDDLDLVVHNEGVSASALLNTGGAFGAPTPFGSGTNFLGPDDMEVGNLSGSLGDVLVKGASRLWLHTLRHSGNGYYWVTTDLGYCDDRIQLVDVDGYSGDYGTMEIGRTNSDTLYFMDVYDSDGFIYGYTQVIDIGNAGYGTFGHADCDEPIDVLVDYSNGDGELEPLLRLGYYNEDGLDFTAPQQATALPLTGSWPVLVDLDEDGLNDLLRIEDGNELHWYSNDGLEPPLVTLAPFQDTLADGNDCFYAYPLTGGLPAGGYWSGDGIDGGFYPYSRPGDNPITYNYTDNNGCYGSATQFIHVIDQVKTIPDSLTSCISDTPYQLSSIPAHATWLSDDYVTSDGLLNISFPYATAIQCVWTDVLGCSVYGSMPTLIEPGESGDAHIYSWEGPDILCTNSDPVQIYRTVGDGTFELIPFDPAIAGEGLYTFIGYPDATVQAECYVNDTLFLQVLPPPSVTLDPFLDTLANTCFSGYPLTGGSPTDGYNYWDGQGTYYFESGWYFDAFGLEGNIPITYTHYDNISGCSNSATQAITVIDSVVVVPDSIVTCPSPDPIQVLTYPNAVWGSNEVTNGIVDVSYPHQQHYLCYWMDVQGCGVYGALAVDVSFPTYGSTYIDCYCDVLCTNSGPVDIERTLADGTYDYITFDPATQGPGFYYFVGYGDTTGFTCPVNDTLFLEVQVPPVVTLDPFLDTLVNSCETYLPLSGGAPTDGTNSWSGPGVQFFEADWYFFPSALVGDIPVTYTHYDDATGCSNSATQYITVIDQVTTIPPSLVTCPSDVPYQLASIPANATWYDDGTTSASGLVDISQPIYTYAYAYWTDVLGCEAQGETEINVQDVSYGQAYISGWEGPDILCTNNGPVQIHVSRADGGYDLIDFDPATAGTGTYTFIGIAEDNGQYQCFADDTLNVTVLDPPFVTLAPFLDTLANSCDSGYPLVGGSPSNAYDYYEGTGVNYTGESYVFDALGLEGNIPVTFTYYDPLTGCSNSATQPITVIDSVVVVPDSIVTCPSPDPIQVLTYPNSVWGSNEVTNGIVDVSFPHQQHYLCYWTDVVGCGVYGALAVNVLDYDYGYAYASCECTQLCTNGDPVTIYRSLPDGSEEQISFDPQAQGAGYFYYVGFGYENGPLSCPLNDTLFLQVVDPPLVALSAIQDTLVGLCPTSALPLTGGSPTDGYNFYDGTGVSYDGNSGLYVFSPFGLDGDYTVTYHHTDNSTGCSNTASRVVHVIDTVQVDPDNVLTCPDAQPVQLSAIPGSSTWGGSPFVSPGGDLDVSTPYTTSVYAEFIDVLGCSAFGNVDVTVYDYTYGSVEVVGYAEPVALCLNTPPVDVLVSQADGSIATQQFDPAQGVGSYDITGFGPSAANCPVDYTLTIVVNDIPTVTLDPFTDTLANACTDGYALTGGSPAGGTFSGPGVTGDFFPQGLLGPVEITYTYTDGNGCSNYAGQPITVIGQVDATPTSVTTCVDPDPLQLQSDPPGAIWSGSPNVTPSGSLDVSAPYTADIIGTWTDVIGCALQTIVPVTVNDYTYGQAYVEGIDEPVSLCTNGAAVSVVTSQADGSLLTTAFDPQQAGAGTYPFVGYAPDGAACPANDTLAINVYDAPVVTLAPFTDTLANSCAVAYALTGGLPVGGDYSGSGVNGDFFAEGLLGDIAITYSFTDANGCSNAATGSITVIGSLTTTPASIETCVGPDPIQLNSDMAGTVWSGSANVTPEGLVDPSSPFTADITGTWTDVSGCELQSVVPVTVNALTNGYAYVQDMPEPVTLCQDHDPVTIVRSLAAGGEETITFDPSTQTPGSYTFTGFAIATADCPVDYVLTIEVVSSPAVTLDLPYEEVCAGSSVPLSGGLPAGGTYVNYNGTGGILEVLDGANAVTYEYADISGCTGSATDQITGFNVTEANGYDTATPDLCPDSDPLTFQPSPGNGTWGGVLTSPVFDPATDLGGAWSYIVTDDAGGSCGINGTLVVLPYTAATLQASLTTVCVSGAPVEVSGTNALGGTIDGPLTLEDPLDPLNPAGTFDPSAGIGDYVFSMDVPGSATSCAQTLTITISVVDAPNVTVSTFTDTLLNICSNSVYTLTQGLPAGGDWSGPGVSGNVFSPFGLSGPQTLTYTFDAGPGCQGSATGTIEVVSSVIASPYDSQTPLFACEDSQPVQLETVPGGSVWAGAAVTPGGFVDMADPFNGILSYLFTDATGCDYGEEVQAVISPYSYGSVTIEQPGATVVCQNSEPFNIILSTASGVNDTVYFDPAIMGPDIYPFVGVAPAQIDPPGCYVDYELTVQVVESVSLDVTDTFALYSESPFVLSGGQPAGGEYGGDAVNSSGEFMPGSAVGGWNTITYTVSSGPCPGTATDSVYVSTVGIADMAVPGTMSVWPVPARNELFISLPAGSTDVLLTLVDADGRVVARRTANSGMTQTPLRWDIGSLANGSYALWTTGRGNMAPARVVIAH